MPSTKSRQNVSNSHRGFGNSSQEVAWFPEGPWDPRRHWVHANLRSSWHPAHPKECPEYLKFVVSVACVVVCVCLCILCMSGVIYISPNILNSL